MSGAFSGLACSGLEDQRRVGDRVGFGLASRGYLRGGGAIGGGGGRGWSLGHAGSGRAIRSSRGHVEVNRAGRVERRGRGGRELGPSFGARGDLARSGLEEHLHRLTPGNVLLRPCRSETSLTQGSSLQQ